MCRFSSQLIGRIQLNTRQKLSTRCFNKTDDGIVENLLTSVNGSNSSFLYQIAKQILKEFEESVLFHILLRLNCNGYICWTTVSVAIIYYNLKAYAYNGGILLLMDSNISLQKRICLKSKKITHQPCKSKTLQVKTLILVLLTCVLWLEQYCSFP